jgi:hypothetical protein
MPATSRKRAIEGSDAQSTLDTAATGTATFNPQDSPQDEQGEDESITLVKRQKMGSKDDDYDVIDLEKSQFTYDSDDNQLAEFDFSGFDDPSMCDDMIGDRVKYLMSRCGVLVRLDQKGTTELGQRLRESLSTTKANASEKGDQGDEAGGDGSGVGSSKAIEPEKGVQANEADSEDGEDVEEIEGVEVANDRISEEIHIAMLAALTGPVPDYETSSARTLLDSKKDTLRSTIRRCLNTVTFSEDASLRALNFSEGISNTFGCA